MRTHGRESYLLTYLLVFFLSSTLNAQCPQRTIPGSTVNVFDWRSEKFDFYLKDENQQIYYSEVTSPFFIENNSAQYNTDHFAEALDLDYQPLDGWELIFYNFGTPTSGVTEPSFALYNRYNGLFRFFMYLSANYGDSYQEAYITCNFTDLGDDLKNSALFESQNALHNSLESFDKRVINSSINKYYEGYGTWIATEWLTHYDPCSCISELKLFIEPNLQSITTLNLSIDGISNTIPIYSTSSNHNDGGVRSTFGAIGTGMNDVNGAYKKGNEVYKNINQLINTTQGADFEKSNSSIMKAVVNLAGGAFTGNPLSIAAGLLSAANTFIGNSKTKTVSSYSTSHKFEASGELEAIAPYSPATVYLPGSKHAGFPEARKPIYDNVMGIASITETPKFDFITNVIEELDDCRGGSLAFHHKSWEYYKLKEDIKYAINTSAGIKSEPKEKKVALYFDVTKIFYCHDKSDEELLEEFIGSNEALIKVSPSKYRTPFMNLSCLKEYPVTIKTGDYDECDNQVCGKIEIRPYLALAMILETQEGEEIAYLKSYLIGKEEPNYSWQNRPANLFLDVPEDITVNYNDIDENMRTWGNTIITYVPEFGEDVLNGDGEHSWHVPDDGDPNTPDDMVITDKYTIDCGEVPPVTDAYLNSFCHSSKYDPIVARKYDNGKDEPRPWSGAYLFPNPTNGLVNVKIYNLENVEYQIYDLTGKKIEHAVLERRDLDLGLYPKGVYLIKIIKEREVIAYEKIIKM